ncbi:hypothetical protein Aglo01_35610 [Actinokineospora globicatena]|nr:hypothetical protein Aglo01_35610 [Actinokineospora globicatena]GLW86511.1 hypothetical protein Aglo02_41500 [Actinokineospora globicatena]
MSTKDRSTPCARSSHGLLLLRRRYDHERPVVEVLVLGWRNAEKVLGPVCGTVPVSRGATAELCGFPGSRAHKDVSDEDCLVSTPSLRPAT